MAKRLTTTGWLANRAKQKADYLNSPKGLIEETIKGLPEAGEKVGKTIGKAMGIVMKVPFSAVKAVGRAIQGISPKELSPEEIKLCHFLRMNMSSKEIASITHKEMHSIDIARYRLRKKLSLEREVKFNEFLTQF